MAPEQLAFAAQVLGSRVGIDALVLGGRAARQLAVAKGSKAVIALDDMNRRSRVRAITKQPFLKNLVAAGIKRIWDIAIERGAAGRRGRNGRGRSSGAGSLLAPPRAQVPLPDHAERRAPVLARRTARQPTLQVEAGGRNLRAIACGQRWQRGSRPERRCDMSAECAPAGALATTEGGETRGDRCHQNQLFAATAPAKKAHPYADPAARSEERTRLRASEVADRRGIACADPRDGGVRWGGWAGSASAASEWLVRSGRVLPARAVRSMRCGAESNEPAGANLTSSRASSATLATRTVGSFSSNARSRTRARVERQGANCVTQ